MTIAVKIAKIGFKSNAKQKNAVKKVANPVLIVRAPISPLYQLLLIKKLLVMLCIRRELTRITKVAMLFI
ncbi:hypothetical protein ABLV94_10585 [Staphylococcus sp. Mo2-7]